MTCALPSHGVFVPNRTERTEEASEGPMQAPGARLRGSKKIRRVRSPVRTNQGSSRSRPYAIVSSPARTPHRQLL